MTDLLTQPASKKSVALLLLGGVTVGGLVWGGHLAYEKLSHQSPTVQEVRQQAWIHLKKQAHRADFKPTFAWTSLTNYTSVSTGESTNTGAPTAEPVGGKSSKLDKASKLKLKLKKLTPCQAGCSLYFRERQQQATSYEAIYRWIGQELWVAEQMFSSSNSALQQAGIVLASEAAHYALADAEDGWLAARICEGYLWPSLGLLEKADRPAPTPDQILVMCEATFRATDETNCLVRNYQYTIRLSPKRADAARSRLAILYERMGEWDKALQTLREIQSPPSGKTQARLAALEQHLKNRTSK
jgi:hypothetical protein